MATSSEHHKKRIESYKTSWAHLCQSGEGKTLWEMVACTPLHPYVPTQCHATSPTGLGGCHQGFQALGMVTALSLGSLLERVFPSTFCGK